MLTTRLTNCTDCDDISSMLNNIDCRIADLSKGMYNRLVFGLNTACMKDTIADLLTYKRILENKFCNEQYAGTFALCDIVSKVKILTLGKTCKKCYEMPEPVCGDLVVDVIDVSPTTTSTTTILDCNFEVFFEEVFVPLDCGLAGTAVTIPSDCGISGRVTSPIVYLDCTFEGGVASIVTEPVAEK